MKGNERRLLSVLLLAVFLVSTGMLVRQWTDKQRAADAYSSAQALAYAAAQAETAPETQPPAEVTEPTEATQPPKMVWVPAPVEEDDPNIEALKETDLAALQQVNGDVLGWIQIPDTRVNYPLTQGADNDFYLQHTWEKVPNGSGSIFLECRNSPDLTDFNTIIYGHNIINGSMFASLQSFAEQEHWSGHPYVYIVTAEGVYRYEIFSSYLAKVTDFTYGLSFNQEKTRQDFLDKALELSEIDTGIVPAITDRIITLSTCSGLSADSRRVVHARLKMIETCETE